MAPALREGARRRGYSAETGRGDAAATSADIPRSRPRRKISARPPVLVALDVRPRRVVVEVGRRRVPRLRVVQGPAARVRRREADVEEERRRGGVPRVGQRRGGVDVHRIIERRRVGHARRARRVRVAEGDVAPARRVLGAGRARARLDVRRIHVVAYDGCVSQTSRRRPRGRCASRAAAAPRPARATRVIAATARTIRGVTARTIRVANATTRGVAAPRPDDAGARRRPGRSVPRGTRRTRSAPGPRAARPCRRARWRSPPSSAPRPASAPGPGRAALR